VEVVAVLAIMQAIAALTRTIYQMNELEVCTAIVVVVVVAVIMNHSRDRIGLEVLQLVAMISICNPVLLQPI
jgi:hypothetical protein